MRIIILILLVTSCGDVRPYQWDRAVELCNPHEGVKRVFATVFTDTVEVVCNNKVNIVAGPNEINGKQDH